MRGVVIERANAKLSIAWPADVSYALSPEERDDALAIASVAVRPPFVPYRPRKLALGIAVALVGMLYAIGSAAFREPHLVEHEVAAVGLTLRGLLRIVKQVVARRDIRRANAFATRRFRHALATDVSALHLDDDGIHLAGAETRDVGWHDVRSVTHRHEYHYVDVRREARIVIPQRAFADGGRAFASALEARLVGPYLLRRPSGSSTISNTVDGAHA